MKNKLMTFVPVGRIKNFLLVFFLRYWIAIYKIVVHRDFTYPKPKYARNLYNSSILSRNSKHYEKWDLAWQNAFSLWNRGEYQKAVRLRTEIMEEVYSFNEVEGSQYSPPFLSNEFCGPFGHNPMIAIHSIARELNLLPKGERYLATSKRVSDRPFIKNLAKHVTVIPHVGPEWSDLPSEWHISERMQLFKTQEGFTDSYPIVEEVFNRQNLLETSPILKLDHDYEAIAEKKLFEYGIGEKDWFVTLHVRSTGSKIDIREQSISDYIPAIDHIISLGGKVIRIGDPSMPRVDSRPGLIDLSRDMNSQAPLHLYALAKAKFFIGTNSGPKMYPPLYGVPSIITNLTSIGLETFTLTRGTIYIPKTYFRLNRSLSLTEILSSHLGYDNFNLKQLHQKNIQVCNSTSYDILKGVQEMLAFVFDGESRKNTELDLQVKRIREQSQFATSGKFAVSWLSQNAEWFLN